MEASHKNHQPHIKVGKYAEEEKIMCINDSQEDLLLSGDELH